MCDPHETVSSCSVSKVAGPDKRDRATGRTSDARDIFRCSLNCQVPGSLLSNLARGIEEEE